MFFVRVISVMQVHQMISKQYWTMKDWMRVYKDLEDTGMVGKAKQEVLSGEVTALRSELAQTQEQLASKEYILTVKEADLANKEKLLAAWTAELVRKQEKLD